MIRSLISPDPPLSVVERGRAPLARLQPTRVDNYPRSPLRDNRHPRGGKSGRPSRVGMTFPASHRDDCPAAIDRRGFRSRTTPVVHLWISRSRRNVMAPALLFADIAMFPGGIIAWLVVGLIAGWMAGLMMKGGGYGVIGDIIVGLIGALVGGFLMGFFVHGDIGFWGSIVVAFLGACVLIGIVRAVSGPRTVV